MNHRAILVALAFSAVRCARPEAATEAEPEGHTTPEPSTPAAPAPALATARPDKFHTLPSPDDSQGPRLRQTSLFAGSTNVGTEPVVSFGVMSTDETNIDAVLASIRARAHFITQAGLVVSAKVTASPVPVETQSTSSSGFTYSLLVSPESSLPLDQWAWLKVDGGDVSILPDAHSGRTPSTDGSRTVAFFTGSMPVVDHIVRKDVQAPEQVHVSFSEPIRIGHLAQGLAVKAGGVPAAGCARWMANCVDAKSPIMNSAVDYKFDRPSAAALTGLQAALSDSVRGTGRSPGEVLKARIPGYAAASPMIRGGDWVDCGEGTKCWYRALPAPPVTK
jgi:hypothetical protein